MDEVEIIHKAKEGDLQAFEKLVCLYQKRVFSFAYYHLRNRSDAEDISQEVFWRVFRSLYRFDESRKFFSWIYSIEMNLIRSMVRFRKFRSTESDEDYYEVVGFMDRGILSAEDGLLLWKLTEHLEPKEKDLLYLKYIDDRSVSEISELLHISETNIKVKLFRAKEKIRTRLEEETHENAKFQAVFGE